MMPSTLPVISGAIREAVIMPLRALIWSEVNMVFLSNAAGGLLDRHAFDVFLEHDADALHRNAALGQIFRIHRAKRVFGNRHVMQARHRDVDRVWSPIELANAAETHAQRDGIAVGQGSGVWSDDVEDA